MLAIQAVSILILGAGGFFMIGAGILWVGWHGFSAGSALMTKGAARMAMLSTHICASAASVTWIFLDW